MTLEELKKKVVTITVHKNIVLGEDLHEDDLLEFLELQEEEACSDERLLQAIKMPTTELLVILKILSTITSM